MGIISDTVSEAFTVKLGKPTLVPPAEKTPRDPYFLSNIDQNFLAIVPTFFSYESDPKDNQKAVKVLKNALSKVLVHYYPLAGRLKKDSEGRLMVDCNGEGAVFVEAEANSSIEVLGDNIMPNPLIHGKLFYNCPDVQDIVDKALVIIQVTKFQCGGFVVGAAVNHCLLDASGDIQFHQAWAETARGLPLSVRPYLDRTILKARNPPKVEFQHPEFYSIEDISNIKGLDNEEFVYKSIMLSSEKLNQLKMKAMENGARAKVSSFETVIALLWKARCQALRLRSDQEVKLLILADGRARFVPPIPTGYFGNSVALASSVVRAGEIMEKPLGNVVGLVRDAVSKLTDSYMRSAIDYYEVTKAKHSLTATVAVTTWSRIPFDKIDFGWGKPRAFGKSTMPQRTTILIQPYGKDMRSINVILGLPASAMKIFGELIAESLLPLESQQPVYTDLVAKL